MKSASQHSLSPVVWGTIGFLWALALWHSWECRGLFWDGAAFLVDMLMKANFVVFEPSRRHSVFLAEIPAVLAIRVGELDLHWISRWWSLGMFGVPTALYSLAVLRARNDAVLLAVTIASIAMVFMTTSFFIVGEFNTAHAAALLAAVCLAMDRLRVTDGIILVSVAALALRTYETFVFLGPVLALMTAWTIWRAPMRPALATGLHGVAALLFLYAAAIEAQALLSEDRPYMAYILSTRWNFRANRQFDLALATAAILGAWAVVRPDELRRWAPYLCAGLPVVVIALLPALASAKILMHPPYAVPQHTARIAGGGVVMAVILFLWVYRSGLGVRLPAFSVLRSPEAARRLVGFAGLMLLAQLPWDYFLTRGYSLYLDELRTTIRAQSGVIAPEDILMRSHPGLWEGEEWSLPCLSVILRSKPTDGIVRAPRGSSTESLQCFGATNPPDFGPYRWHD